MPNVSPCARIGTHEYVFLMPAACARRAVLPPAHTKCGCPVRSAQHPVASNSVVGSWQSVHDPITSARVRSGFSLATAPRAVGKIFGAKPKAAANTSSRLTQLCKSSLHSALMGLASHLSGACAKTGFGHPPAVEARRYTSAELTIADLETFKLCPGGK